jgi:hypothetical protein
MLCPSSFGQNGATSRDRATLFDHFVGDLLDMVRHVETQRSGGLEVGHQLKFRRLLRAHPASGRVRDVLLGIKLRRGSDGEAGRFGAPFFFWTTAAR